MKLRRLAAGTTVMALVLGCAWGGQLETVQTNLTAGSAARAYSVAVLVRLADPILTALSKNRLRQQMPAHDWESPRRSFAPLEACGGDGVYGDGLEFHWDYYNSYVIEPMLLDVLRVCRDKRHALGDNYPLVLKHARRYAAVLERMISPEGTFPVLGRSSSYRFAAFQLLSQMALMRELPSEIQEPAVRAGLTAVIRRMIEAPGTFDQNDWLRVGAVGFQPSIREAYISTGSLYLCTVGLLHLGLPADDPFWTEPDRPWTQKRIWSGVDVAADHALQ